MVLLALEGRKKDTQTPAVGAIVMDECERDGKMEHTVKWWMESGVVEEKVKPRDSHTLEKSVLDGGKAQADMRRPW